MNRAVSLPISFKRLQSLMLLAIATFTTAAVAQTDTPPCQAMSEDRTITFCYPIDGATISWDSGVDWGWIKDSLPHTAKLYLDGKYITGAPDIFNGGASFGWDGNIHTYQMVVTDSKGSFSKSVSFRQSLQSPCPLPTTDPGLVVCKPDNGEVDASPVRIGAVASSSKGISYIQVYVDGVKIGTEHNSGTNNVKMWNYFHYLDEGKHQISIIARQGDNTEIKVHRTITVVTYLP